jgi:hypothetical protein
MMPTQSTTKRTSEMGNRQHRHQRHRRRALETSMTTLLTPMTNATIEKPAGDRDVRPPAAPPKHTASAVDDIQASNQAPIRRQERGRAPNTAIEETTPPCRRGDRAAEHPQG